jgi:hypothetical protein
MTAARDRCAHDGVDLGAATRVAATAVPSSCRGAAKATTAGAKTE